MPSPPVVRGENIAVTVGILERPVSGRLDFEEMRHDQTDSATGPFVAVDRVTGRHDARRCDVAVKKPAGRGMDFGFVANAAALDDLPQLAHHTPQAYEELKEAAGRQPARPKRASSHRVNVS